MIRAINIPRKGLALLILALLFHGSLWSQTGKSVHEGIVRVKVASDVGRQMNGKKFGTSSGGEVITGFAAIDKLNKSYKVTEFRRIFPPAGKNEARHREYGLDRWYELKLNVHGKEHEAKTSYKSLIEVEEAEVAYKKLIDRYAPEKAIPVVENGSRPVYTLPSASDDPMLANQWNYRNTGQTGGTPGADIKLIDAWKSETGNPNVIVAVVDGGIDVWHVDLARNMWRNEDEIPDNGQDDDNNGYVDDVYGYNFTENISLIEADRHATHVAGIIAAVTNNGIGVAGIAGGSGEGDGVRLMSCQVFHDYYPPGGFADAIVYAADNGALICQNSWGYEEPDVYEQVVLDAIDYFVAEAGRDAQGNQTGLMSGGMVIFSSGNSSTDARQYPAYYPSVLAVASTNVNDVKAGYSNFGEWVDICAPGGEVLVAENQAILSTDMWDRYVYLIGTSMACPHASGVAGLVISKYGKPGFTPQMLRSILIGSATNIDAANPDYLGQLGAGRIDAARAFSQGDIPPVAITDLRVTGIGTGEVTLACTAPDDEDNFVAKYDIRFSPAAITESNFYQATSAGQFVASVSAGKTESFTVGAPGPALLYFAVKSLDLDDNASPISNVISHTTAPAPAIALSVSSIDKQLTTASSGKETIRVYNKGAAPLDFVVSDSIKGEDFASCAPSKGEILPGRHEDITVTFDANGLAAGKHEHDLKIFSNDPVANEISVKLVLTVVANGAPIADIDAKELHYNSIQFGTTSSDSLRIHNSGSEALKIDKIIIDSESFSSSFGNATIPPFEDFVLHVVFKPTGVGIFRATVQLYTNDPGNKVLRVHLLGEGTKDPPIVITPSSIETDAGQEEQVQKYLTIKNNGSFTRSYQFDLTYLRYLRPEGSVLEESGFSTSGKIDQPIRQRSEELIRKVQSGEIKLDSAHSAFKTPTSSVSPIQEATTLPSGPFYATNFDEFKDGGINGQNRWDASPGWNIERKDSNPGDKYLRGSPTTPGESSFAVSPEFGLERWYNVMSLRLNIDNIGASTWYIIAPGYYANSVVLRINPDRTMDVENMPTDEYMWEWKRLDVEIPKGYFDLSAEVHDRYGYGTYFNIFNIYIDGKLVHTGMTFGNFIDRVAFVCPEGNQGGILEVDSLMVRNGDFIPEHLEMPAAGTIRPRETINLPVGINAEGLRFGTYESKIEAKFEKLGVETIPVSVHVVGPPEISAGPQIITGDTPFALHNAGGEDLIYTIEQNPNVFVDNPSGSIAPGNFYTFFVDIRALFLEDSLIIRSNAAKHPIIYIPISVTYRNPYAELFLSAEKLTFEVVEGQISNETVYVANNSQENYFFPIGATEFRYEIEKGSLKPGIRVVPMVSDIPLGEYIPLTITLDGTLLELGSDSVFIDITTNSDLEPTARIKVLYNVITNNDPAGTGHITREIWRQAPGRTVSDIPLNIPPSEITHLPMLESQPNSGDQYGSRLRGYITPPQSGDYTFWISSNEASELWLSTDKVPANKQRIAYCDKAVPQNVYQKYPSQKSARIPLEKNRKYYLEILHKEESGSDHLSVGWETPDHKRQFPVPGQYLSPYKTIDTADLPGVEFVTPFYNQAFDAPATVEVEVKITSAEVISKVEFFDNSVKLAEDATAPYKLDLMLAEQGEHFITARATTLSDNKTSASTTVVMNGNAYPFAPWILYSELWQNVSGESVSDIPLTSTPSVRGPYWPFDQTIAHESRGEDYGERIRGYISADSGTYVFNVASDNNSEVWLSTDKSPANKRLIAYVPDATEPWDFDKYASQRSAPIVLEQNHYYYIEVLFKQDKGPDHFRLYWNPVAVSSVKAAATEWVDEVPEASELQVYPNPVTDQTLTIRLPDVFRKETIARWTVTTIAGNPVFSGEFNPSERNSEITIPLDHKLTSGIYLVRIMSGKSRLSKRLMVLR